MSVNNGGQNMNKIKTIFAALFCTLMFVLSSTSVYAQDPPEEIPDDIEGIAQYYGGMYGIDENLILAICYTESSFIQNVNVDSCKGLMQVNVEAHEQILENKGVTDIYDKWQNINCGCMVLYNIMQEYDDINEVLIRYNGDRTGLKRYRETGEVSNYAQTILQLRSTIEELRKQNAPE